MKEEKVNTIKFPKIEISVKDFVDINYYKGCFASFFTLGLIFSFLGLILDSWITSFFSFLFYIESIVFFIKYNRIAKEKLKEIK